MCVCLFVGMYVCKYLGIRQEEVWKSNFHIHHHTYMHVCMKCGNLISIEAPVHVHVYMWACMCANIGIHQEKVLHSLRLKCLCMCVCVCVLVCRYVCMYAHILEYTRKCRILLSILEAPLHIHVRVWMYVCMHTYECIHSLMPVRHIIHTYSYQHVWFTQHMYVYMGAYIYIYIYMYTYIHTYK